MPTRTAETTAFTPDAAEVIGERSGHGRLVLAVPPGSERERSRDGSWTERGHSVRPPIER